MKHLQQESMALCSKQAKPESDQCRRQRLFESLSCSYAGTALAHALHSPSWPDTGDTDPLASSCFAELSSEQDAVDPELMPLDWLQRSDVLKSLQLQAALQAQDKENQLIEDATNCVPYHPRKHIKTRPPYSFSCLIFMALEESPSKSLAVRDIYNWIMEKFPYYRDAHNAGWRNSVRHNLSLNKCFHKVEKNYSTNVGKGSLWSVDPDYRPNLVQALRRTPTTDNGLVSRITSGPQLPGYKPMFPSSRLSPLGLKQTLDFSQQVEAARSLLGFKHALTTPAELSIRNSWSGGAEELVTDTSASDSDSRDTGIRRTAVPSKTKLYAAPSPDHTYSLSSCPQLVAPSEPVASEPDWAYDFDAEGEEGASSEGEEGWGREVPLVSACQPRGALNDSGISTLKLPVQREKRRDEKKELRRAAKKRKKEKRRAREDAKREERLKLKNERKEKKRRRKKRKKLDELEGANALLCLMKGGRC